MIERHRFMVNTCKDKLKVPFVAVIAMVILAGLFPPQLNKYILVMNKNMLLSLDLIVACAGFIFLVFYTLDNFFRLSLSWLVLFIFTGMATVLNGLIHGKFVGMLILWLIFIGHMAIAVFRPSPREAKILSFSLLFVVFANIILGIFALMAGEGIVGIIAPRYATFHRQIQPFCIIGGPIVLSFLSAILIGLLYYQLGDKHPRLIFLGNTILVILSIFWASRSGFLVVAATYLLSYLRRGKSLLTILIIMVIAAIIIANSSYIKDKTRFTDWQFHDQSSLIRFSAVVYSLEKIKDNLLIGSGPGNIFPRGDREALADFITKTNMPAIVRDGYILPVEPHNTYLLAILEFGIVGLFGFILFVYKRFKGAVRIGQKQSPLVYALIAVLIIGGMTESFVAFNIRMSTIIWGCVALVNIPMHRTDNSDLPQLEDKESL